MKGYCQICMVENIELIFICENCRTGRCKNCDDTIKNQGFTKCLNSLCETPKIQDKKSPELIDKPSLLKSMQYKREERREDLNEWVLQSKTKQIPIKSNNKANYIVAFSIIFLVGFTAILLYMSQSNQVSMQEIPVVSDYRKMEVFLDGDFNIQNTLFTMHHTYILYFTFPNESYFLSSRPKT